MFWVVFNDQGWTACVKLPANFRSAKGKKHKNQKRCILVCHAFLWWLITRKGTEALYWALCKALVFPQSYVEMEFPLPKTFFIYLFRFTQNYIKAVPSLHWNSSFSYLLLLEKHKCWSANKSQKSLSGIWKAADVWGLVSSILPSTFLRLTIPLKEVICY